MGIEISIKPRHRAILSFVYKNFNLLERKGFAEKLAKDPLNAGFHLQYAISAAKFGRVYLALAELKTAEYLGADAAQIKKYSPIFKAALPDAVAMNHNQYFRFMSLAVAVRARKHNTALSVLDVGGGGGQLAAFLPDASYCLAEPAVNGISGTDLPFPYNAFDYVVSCHVLEHVSVDQRHQFLD